MYLHWVFCSLALVWLPSAEVCDHNNYTEAYAALHDELNLINDTYKKMRPIINSTNAALDTTEVYIYLLVNAITDVNEKAQSISTQVIIEYAWSTQLEWERDNFCDIGYFAFSKTLFWTPDIVVLESVKPEVAVKESPYVQLQHDGLMWTMDILSLTTTCKMDLYNFPFDIQICNLTLQSLTYTDIQLTLVEGQDKNLTAFESKQNFQTEGEWELLDINMNRTDYNMSGLIRSRIVYKITIKRRPLLYVINLIFPVFCVLVLDVASFFIKASVAEKLGFKVTLLLSSSVLLLILHDKLPSTSSKIPMIGVYCGGIFTLIGISILETIFVNVLISKGEETKSEAPAETKYAAIGHDDGVDTFPMRIQEPTCTVNTQKKASLYWNRAAKIIDETLLFYT